MAPLPRAATLDLLRVFPTRCSLRHLGTLDDLLWGAIGRGAQAELLDLAERKLSKTGMNAGQRVRWLGMRIDLFSGDVSGEPIAEFLGGKERRVRHLARFCVRGADPFDSDNGSRRCPYEDLDSRTLEIIVRTLGRYFPPRELRGFGSISDEIRVSMFLMGIVNSLESKPDRSASEALDSLLDDVTLDRWRKRLSQARDSQRIIRRDAEYCHPTLQQACQPCRAARPPTRATSPRSPSTNFATSPLESGRRIPTNGACSGTRSATASLANPRSKTRAATHCWPCSSRTCRIR